MEIEQNIPQRLGSPGGEMDLIINEKTYSPKHPEYIDFAVRKDTYRSWPREKEHLIEDLCKAGLFHSGQDDECVCFYCDGSLKDWDEDDDPWWEHCKGYHRCPYILATKGPGFVRKVGSTLSKSDIKEANDMLYYGAKINPGLFDQTKQKTVLAAENLDSPLDGTAEWFDGVNVIRREDPIHPDYIHKQPRIKSFMIDSGHKMNHLVTLAAEVGFFQFDQEPDQVTCFQCNVSTQLSSLFPKLTDQNNPHPELWTEHCKLNPWCYCVYMVKGPEFIRPIFKELTQSQKKKICDSDCQKCSFDPEIDPTDVEMDTAGCSLSDEQKAAMSENLTDIIRKDPEEMTPKEIEILRIRSTCFNCHSRKTMVVCLPCGCLCLCLVCQPMHTKYCPRCGTIIEGTIHPFLS